MDLDEIFGLLLEQYADDPVAFMNDMLGVEPDDWQCEVATAVANNPRVSVRSGQGVGKTALTAWVVLWYLTCRPFSKVICTAPTKQQLYDVLWAECAKWIDKCLMKKLLIWSKTKICVIGDEERWWATAKTASKPENMQGYHEDYMLFICDEASGISDPIIEAILGTLSGYENKILMLGNPTRTSGNFFDSHNKDRDLWITFKVSSLDSKRTSLENIEMLRKKYGADSDVFRVRVSGDFPRSEPTSFIPLEYAETAADAAHRCKPFGITLDVGVDVARFGDDETVIYSRIGPASVDMRTYRKQETTATTGQVIAAVRELIGEHKVQRVRIKVDDDGIGGAVTDMLKEKMRELELDWEIYPMSNNSSAANADDEEHYNHFGSESWGRLRGWLEENFSSIMVGNEPKISLISDERLIKQLTTRKYHIDSAGRICIERKADMKRRGLDSPDRADACILAFMEPAVVPQAIIEVGRTDFSQMT